MPTVYATLVPLLVSAGVTTRGSVKDLFTAGISKFPWSAGQNACYRIPSLLRLRGNGDLVAIASERLVGSGGCGDESPSNIILRRSKDGGDTWSDAELIFSAGATHLERSAWSIEDTTSGTIFVFSNSGVNTTTGCSCGVEYVMSKDGGVTFSAPQSIPEATGVYGSGLASGITHSSGRLLGCMRKICRNSCAADFHSMSFYSDDRGASWAASSFLTAGTTERVYMTIRPYTGWSGAKNVRLASYSSDAGATWSDAVAVPALVDWGFADEGSVCSDPARPRLFFVHPDSHERANLTLYRSTDDGQTWGDLVTIWPYSAAYSDSAVLDPSSDGGEANRVGILFERNNNGQAAAICFTTATYDDETDTSSR